MDRGARFKVRGAGSLSGEVWAGQYWRESNLQSFDEFLERKFPGSTRKAYYSMAIHEQLPKIHQSGAAASRMGLGGRASEDCEAGTVRTSIVRPGCTRRESSPRINSSGKSRST